MEPILEWFGTVLRVILAGMIALTPGMLVWLTLLGLVLTARWVGDSDLYQRLFHGGRAA